MKKTARNLLRIMLAVLAAALLGGCLYLNSLMPIITGYAAKNLASAVFVSGREPADVEALDLHFSFIKFTRNRVDFEKRTVTSRFLWSKSIAAFREGYGVTLLRGRGKDREALLAQSWPLPSDGVAAETVRGGAPAPLAAGDSALAAGDSALTAGDSALTAGDSALAARLEPVARALVDERAYNGHPFAFVVLHKGAVVAERYDKGIGPDTRLLSWSMAKSFTNALTGIMAGDGMVDIHAPLGIPEWQQDARKDITLNDLLQMQSGLEWNEDYGNRSDVNLLLHRATDMGAFALSKPLRYTPGTHWYYSSGTTNIVMRALRSRFPSDEAFLSYLHGRLFAPLGIRNAYFEPDMSGTPVGSSYLYATARDYARFGQMYLDDGCVAGKRILPEGWVDYTVTPASDSKGGYGAFFWLNRDKSIADAPEDLFSCIGHDGQRIFIIPSKGLVAVVLGYSNLPDHMIAFDRLLKDILAQLP
ncbi:MAG: serine hydrolase [Bacteroidales bacterium]|nr:serine hydrolase [Bacteroidales bacterium]